MLTQEYLKSRLFYNPETGIFTWKNHRPLSNRDGKVAGGSYKNSSLTYYSRIKIDDTRYMAHRLAWLYVYGEFPNDVIDHINGNGIDNRICNLRVVSKSENSKNKKLHKNNKSGVIGVCWNVASRKWMAVIYVNSKIIHLGSFEDKVDAVAARKIAEEKYGFHQNHGKR